MSKTIKINDRAPLEIFSGRLIRGPIGPIRMDDTVIGRILRSANAPKDMYAIGPNDKMVKLTLDNYNKSEEELFETQSKVDVEAEAKAKAEALRKSLEAKRNIEMSKVEEGNNQNTENISEKEVVKTNVEPEVQVTETVETVIEEQKTEETVSVVEEQKPTEPTVKENKVAEAPKNYNNYNKNYNKNNKNRR